MAKINLPPGGGEHTIRILEEPALRPWQHWIAPPSDGESALLFPNWQLGEAEQAKSRVHRADPDFYPKIERRLLANAVLIRGKIHKKRRWMTENYHRRIQKKWDKRARQSEAPSVTDRTVGTVSLSDKLLFKLRAATHRETT